MDPVSALSVAAAAAQFVSFSGTLLSRIAELYVLIQNGAEDTELDQLRTTVTMLQRANSNLKHSLEERRLNRKLTPSETEIVSVADACNDVAVAILGALKGLKMTTTTKWNLARKAIRTVWHKNKISSLQQRLESLRQQLILNILINIR